MNKRFQLRHTIPVALVLASAVTALCLGVFAYVTAADRLRVAAQDRLEAQAQSRAGAVDTLLDGLVGDLALTANSRSLRDSVIALGNGWRTESNNGDITQSLRKRYVDDNPHGPDHLYKLERPDSFNLYDMAHQRLQAWMDDLRQRRHLADVLVLSPKGEVMYSVVKDQDFARPLPAGALAALVADCVANPQGGKVRAQDGIPHLGGRFTVLAAPIMVSPDQGPVLGVLMFRLRDDALDHVAGSPQGLGETGDSFVVRADGGLRSKPRFPDRATTADSSIMRAHAAAGQDLDLGWRVETAATMDEVLAPVHAMRNRMLIAGLVVLTLVSAIGVRFARGITQALTDMCLAMQRLARGDRDLDIPATGRGDEIGAMAQAMAVFREALAQADTLRREQDRQNQLRELRSRDLDEAMRDFEAQIGALVAQVTQASDALQDEARTMSANAEETQRQTETGDAEASRTSGSVNTMASAATQLSASIDAIDQRMRATGTVTGTALEHAQKAGESMRRMVSSSRDVENVLHSISLIASQTNLLALNATIEAARAGDAGKGFAVVAGEVKTLANQTAKATDEIANQIAAMRQVTDGAAQAVEGIIGVVGDIARMAEEMTAAIEEQGNATREIAKGAEQAAQATRMVSAIMASVGQATASTQSTARIVLDSSRHLAAQADTMRAEIEAFLAHVADSGFHSDDEPFITRAQQTAAAIAHSLEQAVGDGRIGADALFDEEYRPLPGTQPQQHLTAFTALCDEVLPALQNSVLDFDPRVAFCAAVDRNGYLPTHNPDFSHPQGPDADWNDAHCRNRRLFTDQTGMDAARNTQPFLLQSYRRHMGGGHYVMMKDASAPIMVLGRHWGGLRIGYRIG